MVHIKSRKHRRSQHKRSKTRRTRGTRAKRGAGPCAMCQKPYNKADFASENFCKNCSIKPGSWMQKVPRYDSQDKKCYGCLKKYDKADFTESYDYCDKCVHKTWEQVQRSRSEALAKLNPHSKSPTKKD